MLFFFSFGSNNLLNYDKQHNNNNIAPMDKKKYIKNLHVYTLSSVYLTY